MKGIPLVKGSIIRTVFVAIELIALAVISVITFSNDGTSAWGYWGNVAIVFITLSPIFVYVIASAIFNFFNFYFKTFNRSLYIRRFCSNIYTKNSTL